MISAQLNGAFLGLGDPYLLETVGSVVVGGTLIFGGRAVPLGTLLGSLFLVLLVTAMQVAGLKIGSQLVAEGLFIILVLSSRPKEFDSRRMVGMSCSAAFWSFYCCQKGR
jgi:ribose transport system permease protein